MSICTETCILYSVPMQSFCGDTGFDAFVIGLWFSLLALVFLSLVDSGHGFDVVILSLIDVRSGFRG